MSRGLTERRLRKVAEQLRTLRSELAEVAEQHAHLAELADDSRLRSLVSETPLAEHDHKEAQRHADALGRQRAALEAEIARLERSQDELLDRMLADER